MLLVGLAAALSASACAAVPGQQSALDGGTALKPVLATARSLAASYRAAAEANPQLKASLEVLRGNHSEHVAALSKLLGETGGEPDEAPEAADVDGLRAAESKAAAEAVDACAGAPTEYAVLLGEIAACRVTHDDVLGSL